ncbi:MAG: RnfABCDGE type electron transport complex subunit D [bacterium]
MRTEADEGTKDQTIEIPNLLVSASPHIRDTITTAEIMRDVAISLIPAGIASIYFFGYRALLVIVTCVLGSMLTEAVTRKIVNRPSSLSDGSALVTGLLLAYCLPPNCPYWICIVGAASSIVLAKELYGGLGYNLFNPALVGRAILLAAWPTQMTTWMMPRVEWLGRLDAVTGATPLTALKLRGQTAPLLDLFTGRVGGSLGETSALALLIGAAYLLLRRIIDWRIPTSFILTVFLLSAALGGDPLFAILSGGVILGAFFMATDYVTSPITPKGKIIFGLGCGAITVLIRSYGGYPEGVCYAILLMNCTTPLLEKYTQPEGYGLIRARRSSS